MQCIEVPNDVSNEWQELQKSIEGIDVCMLTTNANDGRAISRPMGTQKYSGEPTVWLVTDSTSR